MKSQSRKTKGRNLQKWLRDKLYEYFPLGEGDARFTSMGSSGDDLLLSPKAREYFPFDGIEAKNQEKVKLWQSWDQACSHGNRPLLVVKKNYREPLAILRVEDLLEILRNQS